MAKILKKRNWAFVVYPESAPSDWIEQLQLSGAQFAISPLHDKDLNATGEPKKAHWRYCGLWFSHNGEQRKEPYRAFKRPKPIPLEQVRGIIAI